MYEQVTEAGTAVSVAEGAIMAAFVRGLKLHTATSRLSLVSHAILLTLVREGFCRPAEEGDGEEVKHMHVYIYIYIYIYAHIDMYAWYRMLVFSHLCPWAFAD
jgi:hypothetical protein